MKTNDIIIYSLIKALWKYNPNLSNNDIIDLGLEIIKEKFKDNWIYQKENYLRSIVHKVRRNEL